MTDVVFFSLRHFSYCVDSKMLNEFCILTRRIFGEILVFGDEFLAQGLHLKSH